MKVTMRLTRQTKSQDTYLIEHGKTIHRITVKRVTRRKRIDNMRYAIQRAVGPNTKTLTFLGNRHVNCGWITEWIIQ